MLMLCMFLSPQSPRLAVESLQLLVDLRPDNLPDLLPVVDALRDPLLPLLQTDELRGEDLLLEVESLLLLERHVDGAGELGRVGGGKGDVRHLGGALNRSQGSSNTNGRVGVKNVVDLVVEVLNSLDCLGIADALALEVTAGRSEHILVDRAEAALGLEVLEPGGDLLGGLSLVPLVVHAGGGGKLVGEEPEQTLKVAGDQNVHGRAEGLLDAVLMRLGTISGQAAGGLGGRRGLLLVLAGRPEPVEDIVLVGRDDELVNGQAHAEGEVASEDVAKVARGHDEADLVAKLEGFGGLGEGEVGVEVVDDLGEDTGPVDGVDGTKVMRRVDVGISEQGLDDVLKRLVLVKAHNRVTGYLLDSRRRYR